MPDDLFAALHGAMTRARRSVRAAFGSRLHDLIADRVAHEIADRAEMQLSHEVRAVGLDRLHADPECRRRLFATMPFSDELNDLALAGRHIHWREIALRAVCTSDIVVQYEISNR